MAKKDEEKFSFVRLDNATLVKMTFKNLAKKFARYSKLTINIKKISDKKNTKRKEFIKKLKEIEKDFDALESILPKMPAEEKIKKEVERYRPEAKRVEVQGQLETFSELREEFERLRGQLEEIKRTV